MRSSRRWCVHASTKGRFNMSRIKERKVWLGIVLSGYLFVWPGSLAVTAQELPKAENDNRSENGKSAGIVHQPNLTYCTVNGKALQLDLVCPKVGAGPFPAVVLLHGTGPFTKGRIGMIPLAQELARNGYVAIA